MTKLESAVSFAVYVANDSSHGYSQTNRWGPDYDCSSLVITAFEQAGIKVKSAGATYTGNMLSAFKKCGFMDVTASVSLTTGSGLQRGDVLLNTASHTAIYLGSGKLVHARSSGGNSLTGDQSGNEIRTQSYFNYPWDHVLRWSASVSGGTVLSDTQSVSRRTVPTDTPAGAQVLSDTTDTPTLRLGSRGTAVKTLQTKLQAAGYSCNGVDGKFGAATRAAVILFQKVNHLEADGIVGAKTWAALNK